MYTDVKSHISEDGTAKQTFVFSNVNVVAWSWPQPSDILETGLTDSDAVDLLHTNIN